MWKKQEIIMHCPRLKKRKQLATTQKPAASAEPRDLPVPYLERWQTQFATLHAAQSTHK
jgi:hypothetical protein